MSYGDDAGGQRHQVIEEWSPTNRACYDLGAEGKLRSESYKIRVRGVRETLHIALGFNQEGGIHSVFMNTSKEGSQMREVIRSLAMFVSHSLRLGMEVPKVVDLLREQESSAIPDSIPNVLARLLDKVHNNVEIPDEKGYACV